MASQLGIPMELVVEARRDPAKLPVVLISLGVVLSVAALGLIIFKTPAGIFLRQHGSTPAYLYYGVLGAAVIFGLAEASFGYWVVPCDVDGWHAAGNTVLWVSLMILVLISALGGLAFLKFK